MTGIISDWTEFLSQQGAQFDNELLSRYPGEESGLTLPGDNTLTDLCHYGLISIEGPDTKKFLQGQLTCDMDELSVQHSMSGAYCTPKGRMVSNFRVIPLEEDRLLLRMHHSLVENTKAVLSKYSVFFRVELKSCNRMIGMGVYGDKAADALQQVFGSAPVEKDQCIESNRNFLIQIDEVGQRFECWVTPGQAEEKWQQLAKLATVRGSALWELLTIKAGIGEVRAQTAEMFIPQMLNLQATGAISFSKGCYTGQEIVARTQYRGQAKRRMYRATVNTVAPDAGADVIDGNDKAVGNIVAAVTTSDQQSELLAVLSRSNADNNDVFIEDASHPLKLQELPYSLEEDGS
jgi:folate-binding protein YgfZ